MSVPTSAEADLAASRDGLLHLERGICASEPGLRIEAHPLVALLIAVGDRVLPR